MWSIPRASRSPSNSAVAARRSKFRSNFRPTCICGRCSWLLDPSAHTQGSRRPHDDQDARREPDANRLTQSVLLTLTRSAFQASEPLHRLITGPGRAENCRPLLIDVQEILVALRRLACVATALMLRLEAKPFAGSIELPTDWQDNSSMHGSLFSRQDLPQVVHMLYTYMRSAPISATIALWAWL
jgi:hypothetical protein